MCSFLPCNTGIFAIMLFKFYIILKKECFCPFVVIVGLKNFFFFFFLKSGINKSDGMDFVDDTRIS